MDSIVSAIGELFGPIPGLILALAFGLGGLAGWIQGGALQAPGPDRDQLLRSLEVGGDLRRLYVFWLTRGLNRVDRFLGDADKAAFSLPSPFRNRERAPYWTGWSFDVCALLAVVYPLLGVFAGWVWTGDAGAVGRGLGMSPTAPPALRVVVAGSFMILAFVPRRGARSSGWRQALWFGCAAAASIVGAVSGAGIVAAVVGFIVAIAVSADLAGAGAGAFAGALAGAGAGGAVAILTTPLISTPPRKHRRRRAVRRAW